MLKQIKLRDVEKWYLVGYTTSATNKDIEFLNLILSSNNDDFLNKIYNTLNEGKSIFWCRSIDKINNTNLLTFNLLSLFPDTFNNFLDNSFYQSMNLLYCNAKSYLSSLMNSTIKDFISPKIKVIEENEDSDLYTILKKLYKKRNKDNPKYTFGIYNTSFNISYNTDDNLAIKCIQLWKDFNFSGVFVIDNFIIERYLLEN